MDLIYYFWLTTVEGLSTRKILKIVDYFGSIEGAWDGSYNDFLHIDGITPKLADKIIKRKDEKNLLKEIGDIESKGINIITIDNDKYPEKLKTIYDPPCILYSRGNMKKCLGYIGVVGSRKCTQYGRFIAKTISRLLCDYGVGIVSGMARGIDTEAHLGALSGGGFTCAVLGCGLDIVYPPENKKLMEEIVREGIVFSEYPPGTEPYQSNFPARNRIISGLSDGVLVVEAGEKSGALITADFALEQGREVFAVPGNIMSEPSKGTNALIKDGAKMVTDVADILCEIGIDFEIKNIDNAGHSFTPKEKMLLDVISNSPIFIDDLIESVSLKVNEVNSILTLLELKGFIRVLPGKFVVRAI